MNKNYCSFVRQTTGHLPHGHPFFLVHRDKYWQLMNHDCFERDGKKLHHYENGVFVRLETEGLKQIHYLHNK